MQCSQISLSQSSTSIYYIESYSTAVNKPFCCTVKNYSLNHIYTFNFHLPSNYMLVTPKDDAVYTVHKFIICRRPPHPPEEAWSMVENQRHAEQEYTPRAPHAAPRAFVFHRSPFT